MRILVLTLTLFAVTPAGAAFWEKALMPGPLHHTHADLESDCDSCHARFRKQGRARRCLSCHAHVEVAHDIERGEGLHGRLGALAESGCDRCHAEHRGRDADLLGLDTASFDHARTDFALEGRHAGLACRACHTPDRRHREAPRECVACHEQDDPHAGRLGRECADCHRPADWRRTRFDHDRTEFPLREAHARVACVQCHAGNRYEDTPRACVACHRKDDAHGGDNGERCERCHGERAWERIVFDHAAATDWPLRGAHRETACVACHRAGFGEAHPIERRCVACHRDDDWHKGRNGEDCADCHGEDDWKESRFDHARTGFRLVGRHRRLACVACHKGPPRDERGRSDCASCHLDRDVHRGSAGPRCADCHSPDGWKPSRFDHARDAGHRLTGRHARLACQACHRFDPARMAPPVACRDCHREDDAHQGAQGPRCERCHDTEDWTDDVRFDHDLARFPLIGQHALAPCESCHEDERFKDTPSRCRSCHREDDVHRGTLGEDCAACHNPNAWRAWLFDHDTQTRFALEGTHARLACGDCHTQAVSRISQSRQCAACHADDDAHDGDFGRRCDRCHDTERFDRAAMRPRG